MNKEQEKKFFELICVCNNQQQELDKYKNIVDELGKYLENNKVNIGIKPYSKYAIPVEDILDKLKKLKGE